MIAKLINRYDLRRASKRAKVPQWLIDLDELLSTTPCGTDRCKSCAPMQCAFADDRGGA